MKMRNKKLHTFNVMLNRREETRFLFKVKVEKSSVNVKF